MFPPLILLLVLGVVVGVVVGSIDHHALSMSGSILLHVRWMDRAYSSISNSSTGSSNRMNIDRLQANQDPL